MKFQKKKDVIYNGWDFWNISLIKEFTCQWLKKHCFFFGAGNKFMELHWLINALSVQQVLHCKIYFWQGNKNVSYWEVWFEKSFFEGKKSFWDFLYSFKLTVLTHVEVYDSNKYTKNNKQPWKKNPFDKKKHEVW